MYDPRVVEEVPFLQEHQKYVYSISPSPRILFSSIENLLRFVSLGKTFQARELARARRKKPPTKDDGKTETYLVEYLHHPVKGRVHMDVQTETYLEELSDRPPERDGSTQTDYPEGSSSSPLFMPELE